MAKNTKVTSKDFKLIKSLLNAGLSKSKVCELAERSWGVVDIVYSTENIEEYREVVKARTEKYKEDTEEPQEKDDAPTTTDDKNVAIEELERRTVELAKHDNELADRVITTLELLQKLSEKTLDIHQRVKKLEE